MNTINTLEIGLIKAINECKSRIDGYSKELNNLRYWIPESTNISNYLEERNVIEKKIESKIDFELKDLKDSFRNNRKLGFLPDDMLKRVEDYAEKTLDIKFIDHTI